jgi:hypothetical protein
MNDDDECYYCYHDLQHPTTYDDYLYRRNWRIYGEERWEAQGILTRANSEIDFLKAEKKY